MAVVYLAKQPALGRSVALKELAPFNPGEPTLAQRFIREARVAGSLNHPNVVTVFDFLEQDGVPYIAMEYLDRGSLRPFVGRMSLPQVAGVLEGLLAALSHAEAMGIVHRDVKPENLLVTGDGGIKIADFGIAKAYQQVATEEMLTPAGATVGTPAYMAPEQAMAEEIGPWTDLYQTGVVAYELLTGSVPFSSEGSPIAVLMKHISDPVPPLPAGTDPALADWVMRMLAKDRSARPPSARAAWNELEEIIVDTAGPLWRRDARLGDHDPTVEHTAPLTPARFSSWQDYVPARTPQPPAHTPPTGAPPPPLPPPPAPPTPAEGWGPPRATEPAASPREAAAPPEVVAPPGDVAGPPREAAAPPEVVAPSGDVAGPPPEVAAPRESGASPPVAGAPSGFAASVPDPGASPSGFATSPREVAVPPPDSSPTQPGPALSPPAAPGAPSDAAPWSTAPSETPSPAGGDSPPGWRTVWPPVPALEGEAPPPPAPASPLAAAPPPAQRSSPPPEAPAPAPTAAPVSPSPTRAVRAPARSRRRPALLSLGVFGLVAAGVLVVLLLRDGVSGGGDPTATPTASATPTPTATQPPAGPFAVGEGPDGVAVGAGAVWVAASGAGTLTRIDPASGETTSVDVGDNPDSVVVAFGSVWVSVTGEDKVVRVSADGQPRIVDEFDVGARPEGLAASSRAIWVANSGDGSVSQIVEADGSVRTVTGVGGEPVDLAVGAGAVWVADASDSSVARVDGGRLQLAATVRGVGPNPRAVAIVGRAVWVATAADGRAWRIDADANTVRGSVRVRGTPRDIATDGRRLFVTDRQGDRLVEIDPEASRVAGREEIENGPLSVAVDEDDLWVTRFDGGDVARIRRG